jgi:hypothetical protein
MWLLLVLAATNGCSKRAVGVRDASADAADGAAAADGASVIDVALDVLRDAPAGDESAAPGSIRGADVVVAAASGNIVVVGTLDGTVDLGAGALTSAGGGDLLLAGFNPARGLLWSRRWGDASAQGGGALAADPAGNLFLATSFAGQMDLGGGPLASAGSTDICLAKLDSEGRHQWSRRFGNVSLQWATGAAVDSTGRFVAAGYSQTPFDFGNDSPDPGAGSATTISSIVSLDPSGTRLWSKMWPGAQIVSIAVDTGDNVLVSGSFTNSVDFGGGLLTSTGRTNVFVVSLTGNGEHRWSKRFGDLGSAAALAVAADGQRNLLVTGFFDDTVDFGGGPLVSIRVPGRTVVSRDVFIAKLDGSTGNHIWSRRFGDGEGDQSGNAVAADGAGSVFVTGGLEGSIDFGTGALSATAGETFVAKLDPGGAAVWSRKLAGQGGRIDVAPPGDLLVTGGFPASGTFPSASATLAGGASVFLVAYPP